MLNANKVQDGSEHSNAAQYQQNNLKKKAVKKGFVNLARSNSLKLIESYKETAKEAVFYKGILFTFFKVKANLILKVYFELNLFRLLYNF